MRYKHDDPSLSLLHFHMNFQKLTVVPKKKNKEKLNDWSRWVSMHKMNLITPLIQSLWLLSDQRVIWEKTSSLRFYFNSPSQNFTIRDISWCIQIFSQKDGQKKRPSWGLLGHCIGDHGWTFDYEDKIKAGHDRAVASPQHLWLFIWLICQCSPARGFSFLTSPARGLAVL